MYFWAIAKSKNVCRNKKIDLDMIGSDFYALQFLLKTSTQADYEMDKNRLLVQPGLNLLGCLIGK